MAEATSTAGNVLDAGSERTIRDTTMQTLLPANNQLQTVIEQSALITTIPSEPNWNLIPKKRKRKRKKHLHSPQRPSVTQKTKTPMVNTANEDGQWLVPKAEFKVLVEKAAEGRQCLIPKAESKALVEGISPIENAQILTTPTSSESDQIPRRSFKPRGKRAGKLAKARLTRARPQSFKQPSLDDTTPAGDNERLRSEREKNNFASYAESFRSHDFCVAVTVEPYQDLTDEQGSELRDSLTTRLVEELLEPSTMLEASKAHFRGKAHCSEGVLKFWCEDEFTLAWLRHKVDELESPIAGTKLVLKRQEELQRKILCGLWVPKISMDTDTILKVLAGQNPDQNVCSWNVIRVKKHEEKSGTHLLLRVPESDVESVKLQDYGLFWLLGQIYLRVLDKRFPGGGDNRTDSPNTNH